MFGWKRVRASEIEAQKSKINALEQEVKGYYENTKSGNAYFSNSS